MYQVLRRLLLPRVRQSKRSLRQAGGQLGLQGGVQKQVGEVWQCIQRVYGKGAGRPAPWRTGLQAVRRQQQRKSHMRGRGNMR